MCTVNQKSIVSDVKPEVIKEFNDIL
jgi:hypothetical protein